MRPTSQDGEYWFQQCIDARIKFGDAKQERDKLRAWREKACAILDTADPCDDIQAADWVRWFNDRDALCNEIPVLTDRETGK